jgi:myosin heavy subunit
LEQEKKGKTSIGPPHPFSVGARAHFRLINGRPNSEGLVPNQSVVVCGESGAGKVNFF